MDNIYRLSLKADGASRPPPAAPPAPGDAGSDAARRFRPDADQSGDR